MPISLSTVVFTIKVHAGYALTSDDEKLARENIEEAAKQDADSIESAIDDLCNSGELRTNAGEVLEVKIEVLDFKDFDGPPHDGLQ